MLAGLFGLILPLALIFLWILPLSEMRVDSVRNLKEAKTLNSWVIERNTEEAVLRAMQPKAQTNEVAAIGISAIEESLKRANLRDAVTRLAGGDGGAIELQIEKVDFQLLTNWLSETEPNWGYQIANFRFERTDRAGLVTAEFLLVIAQ
jgi:type II secretory pathway component PulM